jgi:Icc-related predicted phosphoesterase
MARFTIYFATDIHGSERCFMKFLNAGKAYGANAVILGGDVTGKALVPVVEQAGGRWQASLFGKDETADGEAEVAGIEKRIRTLGFYPYRTTPEEQAFAMFILNLVIWVAGWFVYLVAKKIRARQGVDLDATYRELPVE